MDSIPDLSTDLIRILDSIYPKVVITPGDSIDDLMYAAGQRQVIDRLLRLQEEADQ